MRTTLVSGPGWVLGVLGLLLATGCGDSTVADAGPSMDAARADAGGVDGGGTDGGGGDLDAGDSDAGADGGVDDGGTPDAAGLDAAAVDAGPVCMGGMLGSCSDGALECLCCPAGGPTMNCLCTTACTADDQCTDPARPLCNRPGPGGAGICAPAEFFCAWGAVCASPDTPIATPEGERPIAELAVGDLVYTMHEGALVPRPLRRVSSTPVVDHAVVRVVLETGRVLHISGGHPTADGRLFSDLAPGDLLDEARIEEVATVPYEHAFTYDILPDSDTGTYVAGGALIGSTLQVE